MNPKRFYLSTVAAIGLAALLAPVQAGAQTAVAQTAVAIDNDDIGGVVRGPNGPEAGVWVIAETNDLATRFTRSVVTDDQGRYVVPDLPKAKYTLWVRGYDLVDSPTVVSEPGSARAQAYLHMARRTAARLSTLNKDYSRAFPKITVEAT